jgi:hypothetical protein
MRILNLENDSTRFFQQLANAKRRVLVVDYDSVMAPASDTANSGIPCPTVPELLDCIMTTSRTRVVVISGNRKAGVGRHVPGPTPDVWPSDGSSDPDVLLPAMLAKLGDDTAVGFVSDRDRPLGTLVDTKNDSGGFCATGSKNSLQFLVDWLRVCGGEIC